CAGRDCSGYLADPRKKSGDRQCLRRAGSGGAGNRPQSGQHPRPVDPDLGRRRADRLSQSVSFGTVPRSENHGRAFSVVVLIGGRTRRRRLWDRIHSGRR
nr:hypothetical protein [Tanacetum cinerariifolium]